MNSKSILVRGVLLLLVSAIYSEAQTSIFDFRNQTAGIGFNLNGQTTGSSSVNGVTLTATRFPDGLFNLTASGFGVNAAASGDDTDEFDPGEGFTFSFSTDIILNSLNVTSFGATSSGLISFNGGSAIASITATGLTSLSSTFVSAGTVLRFESNSGDTALATSDFSFDSISVTAVPEPSTYALFGGLAVLGIATFRRRHTSRVKSSSKQVVSA
jgi:hypothetical protein